MESLTLENLKSKTSPTIYNRGKHYFLAGKVLDLELTDQDECHAIVEGSWDNSYEVYILLIGEEILDFNCSCPYDRGGLCKHVIAVLLELKVTHYNTGISVEAKDQLSTFSEEAVTDQARLEAYSKLGEIEQRLLKIFALGWDTFSERSIAKTFDQCGFNHSGQRLDQRDLTIILDKLARQGMLLMKETGRKYYSCPVAFADGICERYFLEDSDFQRIANHFKFRQPAFYYAYSEKIESNHLFRNLRIARYQEDAKAFKENYFKLLSHSRTGYTQEGLCSYWMPDEFNRNQVEQLPTGIRAHLLIQKLILQLFELKPPDGYFDYTKEHWVHFPVEERDRAAALLTRISLLRGEREELSVLLHKEGINPNVRQTISGILQAISGQTNSALNAFSEVLKLQRKKAGSRKLQLDELAGIFQVLLRLKKQDPDLEKKVDHQLNWLVINSISYGVVYRWLTAVRMFHRNQRKEALETLQLATSSSAFLNFFKPFCQFWIDAKLVDLEDLKTQYESAVQAGYQWMAHELLALWQELEPKENTSGSTSAPFLVNLLPRIEEWEIAVKALLGLGQNAPTRQKADQRLAWLVDFEEKQIQPRHQSLGKNGWSKGRPVAFQRLFNRELDFLTPQDERILQSISYTEGSICWVYEPALWRQFVGHPILFLWKSPATGVQLVEEHPRLIATKKGSNYQLSLSHNMSNAGFSIHKETPTRYKLLCVSEKTAQIAKALNGKVLNVPEAGASSLQQAIAGLADIVQVESVFEEEHLPTVDADARICVHLLPVGDGFHVEVYAKPFGKIPPYVKPGKGEANLIAPLNGMRTTTRRNLKGELENLRMVKEAVPILGAVVPQGGIWELQDGEQCLQLLLQLSPLVEAESILLEWPKGERMQITHIAAFDQFQMAIKEKNNWFELNGQIQIDEEQIITMQQLLAISEKQGQFVELSPGKFLALTEEFRDRLAQINGLLTPLKDGSFQLHPLATPAIQGFTDAMENLEADPKFKENRNKLEAAFARKFRLPKDFRATLRPYQKDGFQWLHRCAAWGVGACLADDMGLGKTVQALALLTSRAKLGSALVVAPASVCRNWVAETIKFAPILRPILFGEGDRNATINQAGKGDLIIVTYDLMAREAEAFSEKVFATIILDEAQAIKNRSTKRSETAMSLQGDFKIIMTGTPVENHLGELWNLFQFINPGLLGSLDQFSQRFALPIEKYKDANRREQLRRLLQPFILRRKKNEVLKDLPEKTEVLLMATPSAEERAFYEALRRNALVKLESDGTRGGQKHLRILAEIMKLRRAACHPSLADKHAGFIESAKLKLFGEVVADLLANDHKALVFSQFVGHLSLLEAYLKERGISYQYLDGKTPLGKRQQRIEAFQNGEGDVFLISLKAGGTGLNLTAADYVIHMDPWWNPAVEDQATDRAHRIGQERPVTVYRLVTEGTIEEKILEMHSNKRDLADSLLMGTDVSAKLTAEDLMQLLSDHTT